jgi:hypothetical protein
MTKREPDRMQLDITYIAIKNLSVVWAQAKRPFNEKWAREIAEDFDPDKFDPPVVTKPNGIGHYHVVEGQHRVYGAKLALGSDEQQLPCRVVDAEDPARAAEIWLGINSGRKATKPIQHFVIAVVAKREPETEIDALVHRLSYKIASSKGDYCITAVSALKNIHRKFGATLLKATLVVIDKTWPGDASAFGGELLKGYAAFVNEWRGMDPNRLIEVVKAGSRGVAGTPHQLLTSSRAYAEQMGMTITESISEQLRIRYNKNLREDAKLKRK